MTDPRAELAREQVLVHQLYARLDELRLRTERRLTEVRAMGSTGTPQARSERDAFATQYEYRKAQLEAVENRLVFGRLDRRDGTRHSIGRIGLSDDDQETMLVDWRAPAAQPFYAATPANRLDVVRRRHLELRGREVVGASDDVLDFEALNGEGVSLSGESALLAAVTASRTGRMGDIVATIQAEQDAIIRGELRGVLVVQGGPGTGKTAVALHRAAYLLYTHRERLARSGVLVVGPNAVFLRYIEQVLPSLGETGVLLATPEQLVPGTVVTGSESDTVARLKGDLRMRRLLAAYALDRKRVPRTPVPIPYEGKMLTLTRDAALRARSTALASKRQHNSARAVFVKTVLSGLLRQTGVRRDTATAEELGWHRADLLATPELAEALEAMWPVLTPHQFLEDLYGSPEALAYAAGRHLAAAEVAALVRPPGSPWTAADVPLLDEAAELLGDVPDPSRGLAERRRRAAEKDYAQDVLASGGHGGVDDVASWVTVSADVLADRFRGHDLGGTVAERAAGDREWAFGHVIVDEAQELSPMMWRLLMRRCPSRSMTVVGDVAQTSAAGGAGAWAAALEPFVQDRWQLAELTVNYRTPAEIMAVAADVLRELNPELTAPSSVREAGVAPRAVQVSGDDAQALAAVVAEEVSLAGEGTVAVVTPVARREALADALRPLLPGLAVGGGADALDARLGLVDVRQAKGLEFDSVVAVDPDGILQESGRGLSDLYVALTRATQRLTVVHHEALPGVLGRLGQVAGIGAAAQAD